MVFSRPALACLLAALAALAAAPCPAAWIQTLDSQSPRAPKIFALAAVGGAVFAGFETGIWRSFDRGATWEQANNGMGAAVLSFTMASQDSILYSAGVEGGIWRSSDRAANWIRMGLTGRYISCLAPRGASLYAGTCCSGAFRTRDGGATWDSLGLAAHYVHGLAWNGTSLFAATVGGLWRSGDSGAVWTPSGTGLPGGAIRSVAAGSEGIMLVGAGDGIYRSIDSGATWSRALTPAQGAGPIVIEGDLAYASVQTGVFRSKDAGATWSVFASGLPDQHGLSSLSMAGADLFAGVLGAGVWRRPLLEPEATALRAKRRYGSQRDRSGIALPPIDGRIRGSRRDMNNR